MCAGNEVSTHEGRQRRCVPLTLDHGDSGLAAFIRFGCKFVELLRRYRLRAHLRGRKLYPCSLNCEAMSVSGTSLGRGTQE